MAPTSLEERTVRNTLAIGLVGVVLLTASVLVWVPAANQGPTSPAFTCCAPILPGGVVPTAEISSVLGIGPATETVSGLNHSYNFSIRWSDASLDSLNLSIIVQSRTASVVTPASPWTLTLLGSGGTPVAGGSVEITGVTWYYGGEITLTTGMVLSLGSGSQVLIGDQLVVSSPFTLGVVTAQIA